MGQTGTRRQGAGIPQIGRMGAPPQPSGRGCQSSHYGRQVRQQSSAVASFGMGEDARQCKRCEFRWFAKRRSKPSGGGSSFYALGRHHGAAAATATRDQTKMGEYQKWRDCPNCGSSKVKTATKRGFVPSGAVASTSAPAVAPERTVPTQPPPPAAPAGWHDDPWALNAARWWDGNAWTSHVR
jgi:hypothetical protein